MKELVVDAFSDALLDTVKLLPFLFVTYLFMEWLEKKTAGRQAETLRRTQGFAPLIGAAFGVVPQCGFSLMASNLYTGGVIGVGVLIAVFMSTSDEMLPIMLSSSIGVGTIAKILLAKFVIAAVTGYAVEAVSRISRRRCVGQDKISQETVGKHEYASDAADGEKGGFRQGAHAHGHGNHGERNIHELCEQEYCACQDGIWKSALNHTARIAVFIFVFTLVLNVLILAVGDDNIARLLGDVPVLGEAAAGLVGLIPNCAASVIITELYIDGVLNTGAMMSGLLVSAGVGLVVLFRMNRHRLAENIKIAATLYAAGVIWGILINAADITF